MQVRQALGRRARWGSLIVVLATILLTSVAPPAMAEDAEVFDPGAAGSTAPTPTPKPKPKPKTSTARPGVTITGTWTLLTKCSDHDVSASVEITGAGPDGVSGRVFNASNGVDAVISGGALNGTAIHYNNTYSFLGTHVELWTGTVAGSGNKITGTFTGFAANDCHFTLSR